MLWIEKRSKRVEKEEEIFTEFPPPPSISYFSLGESEKLAYRRANVEVMDRHRTSWPRAKKR